jgi:hypothetical protein
VWQWNQKQEAQYHVHHYPASASTPAISSAKISQQNILYPWIKKVNQDKKETFF